jgi:hypothetical protein
LKDFDYTRLETSPFLSLFSLLLVLMIHIFWRPKLTIRQKAAEVGVSLEGKNGKIVLEPENVISTSKALGDLALKTTSSGMSLDDLHPSTVHNFISCSAPLSVVPEVPPETIVVPPPMTTLSQPQPHPDPPRY